MKYPIFDIQLAPNPRDSRIICDDFDITNYVHKVEITADATGIPVVTLHIHAHYFESLRYQGEAALKILRISETPETRPETSDTQPDIS